jgi:branched-chain amino acid transport system substrate-binding protein
VVFGFHVPQTDAYADEGADELRAFKLVVKHLNEGGGMLETMKPSKLTGQGVLGKKVDYVVGDTQTNADAARSRTPSPLSSLPTAPSFSTWARWCSMVRQARF